MLAALRSHYGDFGPTRAIYNGHAPLAPAARTKEPFVLSVGRLWDEAKNVRTLEQVASALPWPIYVAGEDQHPEGGRLELSQVRALGRLAPPDLASWFARAAIYALPARYEPFGLSVLEAAQAGCALVLGDIPSLREVWGDAACFVRPDDSAALTRTLQELIEDRDRRRELAAKARARAARYTRQRMVDGYLQAYAELMGAHASQPATSEE